MSADETWWHRLQAWIISRLPVAAPLLLITIGILHAVMPKRLSLDWQSVTLLILGVVLFFLPMRDLAAMVQSLEVGKLKILMRDSAGLTETVAKAQVESSVKEAIPHPPLLPLQMPIPNMPAPASPLPPIGLSFGDDDLDNPFDPPSPSALRPSEGSSPVISPQPVQADLSGIYRSTKDEVEMLSAVDPRAGLIHLAQEIESVVLRLAKTTPDADSVLTYSDGVRVLVRSGSMTESLAAGLTQFRKIRNSIVYWDGKNIDRALIQTSILNGLSLLSLLVS